MALQNNTKFAAVTVFDAIVYSGLFKDTNWVAAQYKYERISSAAGATENSKKLCTLNTLKVSNITAEGPSLTITGGKNDDVLLKRGKKYRAEIQDALGSFAALQAFGMGAYDATEGFKVTTEFGDELTIVGDGYLINKDDGKEVIVEFIIPRFIPDSIVNINLSSSGDATVFDLNGDILSVKDSTAGNPDIFYIIKPKTTTQLWT